jgi:hypothetical protein
MKLVQGLHLVYFSQHFHTHTSKEAADTTTQEVISDRGLLSHMPLNDIISGLGYINKPHLCGFYILPYCVIYKIDKSFTMF